ncbi:TIGR02302 family protein [soil metagenome]
MSGKLERTLWRARLALLWERLWAGSFASFMVLAIFAIAVLSGLIGALPQYPRLGVLILFALVFLWSLRSLLTIQPPTRENAIRRVERESALDHRPAAAAGDRAANEFSDPKSLAIWEEYRTRQLARLTHLKAGVPRSALKFLDPQALRVPVALGLIAALFLHRGDATTQLADAVRLAPPTQAVILSLDAWLRPPAYTGKAPVMLTSSATVDKLKREGELSVPENSVLVLRAAGADKPRLQYFDLITGPDGPEIPGPAAKVKTDAGLYQVEARLTRPALIRFSDESGTLAEWRVSLIPDAPPKVSFAEDPGREPAGGLSLSWKAADDYGIAGVAAKFDLSDLQDDGLGIGGNGVFLFEPPQFPIALKKSSPREAADVTVHDLTAHPWAGLNVDITLEARDAAGHVAKSQTKTVKLPEREFIKPLARALVEQRKALVMDPEESTPVISMLDAILTWPDGIIDKSGIHLAIRVVRSEIMHARDHDEMRKPIDELWKIALAVEEGDLADARAALEALRKELQKALAEGASPERIAELMDKMREAMDRYLKSMAQEMQRRNQNQKGQNQQAQQGKTIRPEDLQKMLDTIENLARNGANEAAQEMLSQLDEILRNLQPGNQAQGDPQQGDQEMSQMLNDLSELMRRQQQLMDDTMRMENGAPGESQPGEEQNGQQQGQQGEQGQGGKRGPSRNGGALADQQNALREMLDRLTGQMGQNGLSAPPSFGDAGRSMKGAEGALRDQERDPALSQQGDALNSLREGAQNMARQMMQQGQGQADNTGRQGPARGEDRDPLGRPYRNTTEDFGPKRNMLPGEIAIRRAREILEMLRSRANTPDLPMLDRDYLERLLRGLY